MRKIALTSLLIAFLLVLGAVWYLYTGLKVSIEIPSSAEKLAAVERIDITIKPNKELPIGKLKLYLEQGNRTLTLYDGPVEKKELELLIKAKEAGFKNGPARLVAYVKLPLRKELVYERTVYIDTTPPEVEVLHRPHRLVIGEPGVLEVQSSPDTAKIYVQVGKARFPFLPEGDSRYKTVFTAPLFLLEHPDNFYIVAVDEAGNEVKKFLPVEVRLKKFRQEKIILDEETLKRIVLKYFPDADNLVERFKEINTLYREEDEKRLVEICSSSEPELFAKGAFLQLPGSKPTAYYGDHRFYYYRGKLISESYHNGLDLAKYRHAPVVAANDGKVVFTGRLKVYGNAVIIDHGYGVFTLYGHMNDFSVKVGQEVKKGQVIGHTDTTGLALGDHLHFGVLVWGYAANPIFFLDGHYLNYYFYRPLEGK